MAEEGVALSAQAVMSLEVFDPKMVEGITFFSADQKAKAVFDPETLMAAQQLVRRMPVGDSVVNGILDLVRAARPMESNSDLSNRISWGPGPRASQTLMLAVRARALLEGRMAPSLDDVAILAEPVLKHRMAVSYAARADGHSAASIIAELVDQQLNKRSEVA